MATYAHLQGRGKTPGPEEFGRFQREYAYTPSITAFVEAIVIILVDGNTTLRIINVASKTSQDDEQHDSHKSI